MDIHRGSYLCKENGNSIRPLSMVKDQQSEVLIAGMHNSRTPLADVKNRHSQRTPGLHPTSRKLSIDSCIRLDFPCPHVAETPKRQERNLKSRKSCNAGFNIPQDLLTCENRAVGITLPCAIEEEPESVTLQSQMLSGTISVLSSAAICTKTEQIQQEVTTLSTSLLCLTSGKTKNELDLGNNGTVTDTCDTNKDEFNSSESDRVNEMSIDEVRKNNKSQGDEMMNLSSETKLDHVNVVPASESLHSSVISLVESETDKLVDMLVQECASDLSKSFGSFTSDLEMGIQKMSLDQPNIAETNMTRCSSLQLEAAREALLSPSGPRTTSNSMNYVQEQCSTPKAAPIISRTPCFLTPHLSSPFDLMNISDSSFKEELHKTDLVDLIKSYLLNNSGTTLEEFSYSAQGTTDCPLPDNYNSKENSQKTYSSDKNALDSLSNISESVLEETVDTGNDKIEEHVKDEKKICNSKNEKLESELKEDLSGCGGNIQNYDTIKYTANKDADTNKMPLFLDEGLIIDSGINQEIMQDFKVASEINDFCEVVNSHTVLETDKSVNGHIEDFKPENEKLHIHTLVDREVATTKFAEQSSSEKNGLSVLKDHLKIVDSLPTTTLIYENGVDISLSSHHFESEVTTAATNTSASVYSDACVLTDHPQTGLVDTSMVTASYHVPDVSIATNYVNTFDHSVLAVPEYYNQETMTERQNMVDAASTMTPLKLGKQGKRLTAEEIRRQHPRIVANQLETLMSANQRLQKEVDAITQDRDRLMSAMGETKSKLAVANKQLNEEKERQGGVISVIEQYHHKTLENLESSLKEKQEVINHLESELREVKLKNDKTQEELKFSNHKLQEKCAALEKLNLEAEQHFAEEAKKLKSQFEENDYKHEFLVSQQVIREIQAEVQEFAHLMIDIENWASLQSQLQSSIGLLIVKSQKSARDHANMYEQFNKEKQFLHQQYTSLQTDLEVAWSENQDLRDDILNINDILKRSEENYTTLNAMYQAVKQDLTQAEVEIAELNSKIEFGYKIVKDLMKEKVDLSDQLSENEQQDSMIMENLKTAEEKIRNLEQLLEVEKRAVIASNDKYVTTVAEHEVLKSKLELTIENLRNTLDSWEVDKDVMEQEINHFQDQIARHRTKMDEMSKELQTLRKIKPMTQTERECLQELKNTNQFLEAEKQLYLEAITEYRTRLDVELELAASNNSLIEALRSNNSELQQSNDQLMSDVQALQEDLSVKTVDIDTSWTAMGNLQEKMESVLASLQQKFGIEVKQDIPAKDKFVTPMKSSSSLYEGTSLVALCLSAAKSHQSHPNEGLSELNHSSINLDLENSIARGDTEGKTKVRQSNVQYGALQPQFGLEADAMLSPYIQNLNTSSKKTMTLTDSKKPILDTSRASESNHDQSLRSRHRVRMDISRLYPEPEQNKSTPGYAKICSIPSTMDRTLESMAKVRADRSKSADMNSQMVDILEPANMESLLSEVKVVDRLFNLILKSVDMAERASQLIIKDLKADVAFLKEKLKFQRNQSSDLETELSQKSAELIAANSQIKELNVRVNGMTKSLLNFQDQKFYITRLEEDKAELNRKIHGLREEVKLLSEQLEDVIQKMDDVKSGQKPEGACVREIVNLKRKNHELMMKLFDERDKNKEVGEKAIRRMKILEGNWQKAEAEVCRFDDLVERIRETCVGSHAQSTHPAILHIVRLIDGLADQSGTETSDRTPHKSYTLFCE